MYVYEREREKERDGVKQRQSPTHTRARASLLFPLSHTQTSPAICGALTDNDGYNKGALLMISLFQCVAVCCTVLQCVAVCVARRPLNDVFLAVCVARRPFQDVYLCVAVCCSVLRVCCKAPFSR